MASGTKIFILYRNLTN